MPTLTQYRLEFPPKLPLGDSCPAIWGDLAERRGKGGVQLQLQSVESRAPSLSTPGLSAPSLSAA